MQNSYIARILLKSKKPPFGVVSVLAPQTGLEPVTPRLTAACSTDWAIKAFKVFYHLSSPKVVLCRHCLIFPGRFQPSIVSTDELNYCVRDGNGWTLIAKNTDYLNFSSRSVFWLISHGDPYEIRTRVAGVRGRCLRPLDQRAVIGTPSGTRTLDTLIKSQVLYQLS